MTYNDGKIEYKTVRILDRKLVEDLEALRKNPCAMEQMKATSRLIALMLGAQIFGYAGRAAYDYAFAQLTDAERAAIAKDAAAPEWPLLGDGQ